MLKNRRKSRRSFVKDILTGAASTLVGIGLGSTILNSLSGCGDDDATPKYGAPSDLSQTDQNQIPDQGADYPATKYGALPDATTDYPVTKYGALPDASPDYPVAKYGAMPDMGSDIFNNTPDGHMPDQGDDYPVVKYGGLPPNDMKVDNPISTKYGGLPPSDLG